MFNKLFFFFIFCTCFAKAQLQFTEQNTNLGTIAETYEIKGDVLVKNTTTKKVFLMRADADKGIKVFTTKKSLLPGDTCLIIISFLPESAGKFKKNINIISSDNIKPYELSVSGNLEKLRTDDKLACFYFGNRKISSVKTTTAAIVAKDTKEKRDNTNKIPDNSTAPIITDTIWEKPAIVLKEENPNELSVLGYKPNNILFLVDVSSSMKDSLKLPLMKTALHTLINAVREVDVITFVTYADSVKIVKEGIKGSDKKQLHDAVDGLKAKGLTKGNKAILFSQQLAQKHFIAEGNNQIIMASDGKFRFYSEDQNTWGEKQKDKKIVLSTIAFGNDRDAMKNLKEIADIGKGSFIHIKKRHGCEDKLLEEVKTRSKR
ncbi:MAG: VWA domain-containing protein [Bacteroidetes bacterium]|nr:VWA domain-containing protein [Bacteroidota bacterium]